MKKTPIDNPPDPVREKIAEQAFDWIVRLDAPTADATDDAAFAEWLKESPVHVEEFLTLEATWRALDNLDPDRAVQINELVADANPNVVALDRAGTATTLPANDSPAHRRWMASAATAATIAILAIVFARGPWLAQDTHVTGLGEQTSFTLDDGSVIHLNTQSELRVQLTDTARDVTLLSGEALFQVARDPNRPFRVTAANTVVEALGTRFNVYHDPEQTAVTVVEGKVAVSQLESIDGSPASHSGNVANLPEDTLTLVAGEQVEINPSGSIERQNLPDTGEVTAWRERRLVFRADTLATIAEEFNRYNRLRIEVRGNAANRQLTGVFDADDPASLVEFLSDAPSVRVTHDDERIVIDDP